MQGNIKQTYQSNMQKLRIKTKVPKQRAILSNVNPTETQQQIARTSLIELSNLDCAYDGKDDDKCLEFSIQDPQIQSYDEEGSNKNGIQKKQRKSSQWTSKGRQIVEQFKQFTQDLKCYQKVNKLVIQNERNYHFGDKFISVSLRNPLATTSYLVSGSNKIFVTKGLSSPTSSQYIIRQQRNLTKLKKLKSKTQKQCLLDFKDNKASSQNKFIFKDKKGSQKTQNTNFFENIINPIHT